MSFSSLVIYTSYKNRGVKYSIGNIVDDVVITRYDPRWVLDSLG